MQPESEVTWQYSSYYSLVIESSNRVSGQTAAGVAQRLETLKQYGILGGKDKLDIFLFNKDITKLTKKTTSVAKFDFNKLQKEITSRASNPIPSKGARLHDAVDYTMQHMRSLTEPELSMNKILILFIAGKDTASTNVRSINLLSQKIMNPQINKFNMASISMNMSSTSSLFKLVPPECRYCSLFYRGGCSRPDIDTVFEQLYEYLKQYREEYEKLEKQREMELLKQRQLAEEEERQRLLELEKEKLRQLQLEQPNEVLIPVPQPQSASDPEPEPEPTILQPPPIVQPTEYSLSEEEEQEEILDFEPEPPKTGIKRILFIVFKWGVKRPTSKVQDEEESDFLNEPETCFGVSVKLLQGLLLLIMLAYLILAVLNLVIVSKVLTYIIFISFAPVSLTSQVLDNCSKSPYYSSNELPRFFLGLFYIFLYWLWIFCFITTAFTDEFLFVVLNSGFVIIILCVEFLYRGFNEVKETYFDCEGGKFEEINEVCEDSAVCGIQVRFCVLSIFCAGCLIITAALLAVEGQEEHLRRNEPLSHY